MRRQQQWSGGSRQPEQEERNERKKERQVTFEKNEGSASNWSVEVQHISIIIISEI